MRKFLSLVLVLSILVTGIPFVYAEEDNTSSNGLYDSDSITENSIAVENSEDMTENNAKDNSTILGASDSWTGKLYKNGTFYIYTSTEPTTPSNPSEPTTPTEPTEPSDKPAKIEKAVVRVYDYYNGKKVLREKKEVKKGTYTFKAKTIKGYYALKKEITVKVTKDMDVVFYYDKIEKPEPTTTPKNPTTPKSDNTPKKSPKTGENSATALVAVLALLAFMYCKKKEKE